MDTEKWEYTTLLVSANIDAPGVRDYLATRYPGWKPAVYSPESLDVFLNELGEKGWELVHMQPVAGVGTNRDINFPGTLNLFSNTFFCVLKRRKAA